MSIFERLHSWRMNFRRYPAYRILERMGRVAMIGAVAAAINTLSLAWTGTGFDQSLTLSALLVSAGYAGIDKLKNEWRVIKQEYNFSTWEGIKSLFEKD